jgi:hypothetical protein
MVAFCGWAMSKGGAIDSNMAHGFVNAYAFFNKNNNIAVVFFYNNFRPLHTTMSLVSKSGKRNIFMTTGISIKIKRKNCCGAR